MARTRAANASSCGELTKLSRADLNKAALVGANELNAIHSPTSSDREIGSPFCRSIHRHAAALVLNGPAMTVPVSSMTCQVLGEQRCGVTFPPRTSLVQRLSKRRSEGVPASECFTSAAGTGAPRAGAASVDGAADNYHHNDGKLFVYNAFQP